MWAYQCSQVNQNPVSYTHLRAHETVLDLVCRLLLEKKNIPNFPVYLPPSCSCYPLVAPLSAILRTHPLYSTHHLTNSPMVTAWHVGVRMKKM
ncbi:hypothetical protein PVA38_11005 [Streptococcus pneumoniae D39]|nr:hypothetical protein PVA38_11005 [Streptococcus pneumoniae D39]